MFNLKRLQIDKNLEKIFRDLQFVHLNKKTAKIFKKSLMDSIRSWAFRDL